MGASEPVRGGASGRPPRWLVVLWIGLAVVLAAGAAFGARRARTTASRDWEARLATLADQHAAQVHEWLRERRGEARLLARLPAIADLVQRPDGRAGPAGSDSDRSLGEVLQAAMETYGCRSISVFGAGGRVAIERGEPTVGDAERLADVVRRSGREASSLLASRPERTLSVGLAVPIFAPSDAAAGGRDVVGVVLLTPDPSASLFPVFSADPLPTSTDEAYLVARQGDSVRVVSPRHRPAPAAAPPLPRSGGRRVGLEALAASQASGEFVDDRGETVLAATRRIPELACGVVVQVDLSEALARPRREGVWIWLFALALYVSATGFGLAAWRQSAAAQSLELAERQRRLRALLDHVEDGVVVEEAGRVVLANPAARRMFGAAREEDLTGRSLRDLVSAEAAQRLLAITRSSREGAACPQRQEIAARRLDGSPFDLEIIVSEIEESGWRATQATLRDVTGRREMERALRRSEERYRALFERNRAGLYRSTPEGRILECNEAFARMLGFSSAQEAMAQPASAFSSLTDSWTGLLDLLRAQGSLKDFETRALRGDGTEVWVLETIRLARDPDDGSEVLEATLIDISERKNAEESVRASEQRYRSIFDRAPLGILQCRPDGTLITANPRLAEILGYDSPEELLSVRLEHVDPGTRGRTDRGIEARRRPGSPIEVEWTKRDGTPIWVELDRHALVAESDEPPVVQVFVRDLTERRRGEEDRRALARQLAQSQKIEAVGQLAGGIAHDFNNLLTAIGGYTELLIGSLPADDPRRQHTDQIRRAAERATSLTRQLLAFSRRQVLDPKIIDLNQVLGGMEEMLRRLIGEHIELRIHRAADLWPTKADPGQLEQAILNLVVNARDAMPDGGQLTIETTNAELDPSYADAHAPAVPGPYTMVAVTDTGTGMTADVRARLFEPFFTTKEQGKGTGLGLSTTYGIVKQSGGFIWCYSEPGHGTSFKIYLPRATEAGTPRVGPAAAAAGTTADTRGEETILLVEDEPEVRALVQRLLKMQGYTVVSAANPDEALAITRDFRDVIHLMVTDVVMPGMSGRQLADRLASTRPQMRVLFVSGYTDDAIVHHGILDPGTAFLQKPFTPQALAHKVREVLAAPPPELKVS